MFDELAPLVRAPSRTGASRRRPGDGSRLERRCIQSISLRAESIASPADVARGAGARQLEDAGRRARRASRPIPKSSSSAAKVPGTGSPSRALMAHRARRREAERAGPDRPPARSPPSASMSSAVAASLLRAAFAHHVGADGAMGARGCRGRRRAPSPLERVEVLRERLPVPLDALGECRPRDVLHALHELDHHLPLVAAGSAAKPTPQLPTTAVVTPCQPEGSRCGSQVAWAS